MARAPQLTRRDAGAQNISTVVGTGGDYQRNIARTLGGITSTLAHMDAVKAKRAAQTQQTAVAAAQKAGNQAGYQGGILDLRDDDSDEARAYNAAASRSYLKRIEVTARGGLSDIASQYAHDPAQMREKMTAFAAGHLAGTPADIAGEMTLLLDSVSQPYLARAQDATNKALLASDRAAFLEQSEVRIRDMQRSAYFSNLGSEGDANIAGQIDGYRSLLLQHGPKAQFEIDGVIHAPDAARSGTLTPESIVGFLGEAEGDMRQSRILGSFERLDDEAAQSDFVAQFAEDFEAGEGVAGQLTPEEFERVSAGFASTLRGHETARRAKASDARAHLREIGSIVSDGLDPGEDALAGARVMALASGDPDVVDEYNALKGSHSFMSAMRTSTPQELRP